MQQGNTKERIVEAYIELESERPLEKITVTALVERSRITRKTFYYYFKDIYDLMEYRMEREMKRVMEETMSQPDPEKALAQLYMYIMENQKHIRALSESAQFMALRRQMGEKVYQYFYNHLERIGMFKKLTMPEAAMAVQIIIPDGGTQILEGDRVVVYSQKLPQVEGRVKHESGPAVSAAVHK